MDRNSLSESVITNPYIIEKIVRELDIRTLFKCYTISKDFFDASVYENEKRKDIIHLYLLRSDNNLQKCKDEQKLKESFLQYTRFWLNMRPKNALILIGGYRHSIDYRLRENSTKNLCEYLPKDCEIIYIDVGNSVLTSSIRFKSLTNFEDKQSRDELFQRTSFPCMSCLLFSEIEGIEVHVYDNFDQINAKDVKSVVFLQSSKLLERNSKINTQEKEMRESIHKLIEKLGYNVGFGGGYVNAIKTMKNLSPKEDFLRNYMIITFGGERVRSASIVMSTVNKNSFFSQLIQFKSVLDFDCNDWQKSTTIAFIFANTDNFSPQFTTAFQSVFPCVGIFGFQTMQQMYGHYYSNDNSFITRNKFSENIDPKRNSIIVLVNFEYKKF